MFKQNAYLTQKLRSICLERMRAAALVQSCKPAHSWQQNIYICMTFEHLQMKNIVVTCQLCTEENKMSQMH